MGKGAKTTLTSSPAGQNSAHRPPGVLQQDEKAQDRSPEKEGRLRRLMDVLSYVPPNCRYDPEKPFQFSLGLNILFGVLPSFTAKLAVN